MVVGGGWRKKNPNMMNPNAPPPNLIWRALVFRLLSYAFAMFVIIYAFPLFPVLYFSYFPLLSFLLHSCALFLISPLFVRFSLPCLNSRLAFTMPPKRGRQAPTASQQKEKNPRTDSSGDSSPVRPSSSSSSSSSSSDDSSPTRSSSSEEKLPQPRDVIKSKATTVVKPIGVIQESKAHPKTQTRLDSLYAAQAFTPKFVVDLVVFILGEIREIVASGSNSSVVNEQGKDRRISDVCFSCN